MAIYCLPLGFKRGQTKIQVNITNKFLSFEVRVTANASTTKANLHFLGDSNRSVKIIGDKVTVQFLTKQQCAFL